MHPRSLPALPFRASARLALVACMVLLAGLFAMPAQAVELEGLHEARVEVRGQDDDERERGFRNALRQVIVRVVGRSDAPLNRDVEDLLESPARYVQSFRYRAIDEDEREAEAGDEEPATHHLLVTFNGDRLERHLREAGVPVWGARRPEILAWVAVDEARDRYIVGTDDGADARAELEEHAERRGVPLMLPLLDVEDRDRIEFIDIRAPFLDAVAAAGLRYRADTMLVGHVERRAEGDWIGEWTLVANGGDATWRVRARNRGDLLGAGIDGATDRLAARLAGTGGEGVALHVTVDAVRSLSDYRRVAEYLGGLARVQSADIDRLTQDSARFRIALQGPVEDFERAISADSLLDPAPPPAPDPEPAAADIDALDALVDDLLAGDGRDADAGAADPDAVTGQGDSGADDGAAPASRTELFYRLSG